MKYQNEQLEKLFKSVETLIELMDINKDYSKKELESMLSNRLSSYEYIHIPTLIEHGVLTRTRIEEFELTLDKKTEVWTNGVYELTRNEYRNLPKVMAKDFYAKTNQETIMAKRYYYKLDVKQCVKELARFSSNALEIIKGIDNQINFLMDQRTEVVKYISKHSIKIVK